MFSEEDITRLTRDGSACEVVAGDHSQDQSSMEVKEEDPTEQTKAGKSATNVKLVSLPSTPVVVSSALVETPKGTPSRRAANVKT